MKPAQFSRFQVVFFTFTRMILSVSFRMVYPFLTVFARGLGVSVETFSLALTIRSAVGSFTPLLAPVSDRKGRKVGMLIGLALFSIGMIAMALFPSFGTLIFALSASLLGVSLYLSAVQAHLGDQVAYAQRGAVLALVELSWSLAFIVCVPLVGLLITGSGWLAPFVVMAVLGVILLVLTVWLVPHSPPPATHVDHSGLKNLQRVLANRSARSAMLVSMALIMANEVINLMFGVWMEDSFGLKIAALGAASAVIGFSELSGELISAGLVDRFGKQRSVRMGLVFTGLAAVALPLLGRSLWGALIGLFLFYLCFEFTVVCNIPLMTQVMPSARATVMGLNMAASTGGRAIAALAAPYLYRTGFLTNGLVSMAMVVVALIFLTQVQVVDEPETVEECHGEA